MKHFKEPKITLVGAGPGDAELISVKGMKAIQSADVVLYDALVNPELLDYAPAQAVKVFVGKRRGTKAYTQQQINAMLVDFAYTHGHVVRLKGGDPFVFGRGMEEIQFADGFNISTSVIPGISSSIAVPALAGIPVSHRGVANSFWVLTATQSDGSLNPEIANAVNTSATVIILMGLAKLSEIADTYICANRKNELVAVISNGSLPTEKTVSGTIENICRKVNDASIAAPAVIVVGQVVGLLQRNNQATETTAAIEMLEKIKQELGLQSTDNLTDHE
jgi:uroporphyrin-III C-methyltransferase